MSTLGNSHALKTLGFQSTSFFLHLHFSVEYLLDLDPVIEYLSAFYPKTGRPAKNQVQVIRSFILMVMLGIPSLTSWGQKLTADSLLASLIGHTLYMLCSHNAEVGLGLPLHIRFLDAARTPFPLMKPALLCAWLVSVWSTGDTAGRSLPANDAARSPAAE